ncbi:MAG TPA: methyltransferase domain-containing protein [Candidatus Limnocylindria bacterium]|nr:methyltransferase domain-containing protein [Candidatus Limnocylindria bacterium]
MAEKFSEGVASWQNKLGLVRDAVRQELVSRQLLEHLPSPALDINVLDVGSGQGTQAIHLANLGYAVTGVEPSEELRKIAEQDSERTANPVRFLNGTLENMPTEAGSGFDVVCCHGVLMYLPELEASVSRLVSLVRPGGILSVLTRNRASIAMRAGMSQDWLSAIKGFDERYYANRLGINEVRADEPEEVIESLRRNGAELINWFGVRLFTDHWEDQPLPEDFDELVEAEYQAGRRDPYRQLTSLTHVIAQRAKI